MKAHALLMVILVVIGLLVPLAVGLRGCDYYRTPLEERPFHPRYDELKPSGIESHGYGVVGSLMILGGVAMYSSRKRLSLLRGAGPIRTYLSVHIFLCLLGPALVLYHTTFKFGGLVAVSVWSMLAVVASGIIGRYLYTQIPKTIQGQERTREDLEQESESLRRVLMASGGFTTAELARIDALAGVQSLDRPATTLAVLTGGVTFDLHRRWRLAAVRAELRRSRLDTQLVARLSRVALQRSVLQRRIGVLEHSRRVFHLWHVIHLPFTIVMFAILLIHVGVAVAFGYWWVW